MSGVVDLADERRRRVEDAVGVVLASDPALPYADLLARGAEASTASDLWTVLERARAEIDARLEQYRQLVGGAT